MTAIRPMRAGLVLAMSLLIAACGGSAASSAPTGTPAPAATPAATPAASSAGKGDYDYGLGTPSDAPAATAAAAGATALSIANFAFDPATVTVQVGAKVTWTNSDGATHTATALDGSFDSGRLANGASFSFTFTKAGTYAYHCAIHASMTGTITVSG